MKVPGIFLVFAGALTVMTGVSLDASAADIVLGHISSVANPASMESAKDLRAGIQLAFDAANAAGGINGNRLKLETRDDALDAPKMVALADELIADPRVIGFVGFLNTGGLTELAKADAFARNEIAMVAPSQGNANIVEAANVFPFRSGYNAELAALLKEAQTTFKQRVAIVSWNIAFGPPVSKFAIEHAAGIKLPVVATPEIDAKPNGDLAGSIDRAIAALQQAKPDAVIVVAAGKPAEKFFAALRASSIGATQVYAMSIISPPAVVANIGEKAARGIVLSQATPYPYVATSRLVTEYRRALRELAPGQRPTFTHLEGFTAGSIAIAALAKINGQPTRQSLLRALYSLGTYDLGGYSVSYSRSARRGWGGTELVIIGRDGQLLR